MDHEGPKIDPTAQLLRNKFELHKAPEVKKAELRKKNRTGEKVPSEPKAQISNYLDRLIAIVNPPELEGHPSFDRKERNLRMIKERLYNRFVIKPENIPDSYWDSQRRIIRERGQGGDLEHMDFEELKRQNSEIIIADQKSRLDTWVDYLSSSDAPYSEGLKYYTLRNVLTMSDGTKQDDGTITFGERSKGTTKPFPDLNREALAYVLDALTKKYKGYDLDLTKLEQEDKQRFEKLLGSENFPKLYAWAIEKVTPASAEQLQQTQGEWIKYDQGSDPRPLFESLQGKGTNWCTAAESTANVQLKNGDFYVYYSFDKDGKPTIPRIAIRMERGKIAEVRGIAKDQNLDEGVTEIVDEKLKEFPDGEQYKKKVADMRRLTAIEHKVKDKEELDKEELRFLYEVDGKIQGFGYSRDPRIEELLQGRVTKEDIAFVFDCLPSQISTTSKEALRRDIVFHYGSLDLHRLTTAEGFTLPESVGGDLNLRSLTTAEGLTLPKTVGGGLDLGCLTTAEGLTLPESVGGDLYLWRLTTAEELTLPESVGGDLYLSNLTTTEGLTLPESVGGLLNLSSLTTAEGLTLPKTVGGGLDLGCLTTAEGLTLPESVGGDLDLGSLTTAEELTLPESVGGDLYLSNLTTAEGLTLPKSVGGFINLKNLTTAEGLTLPKTIGGGLDLGCLTTAEGLTLPESIGGGLDLGCLTTAEGLTLPESIGGSLILSSLTTTEGLTLPESVGGRLNLSSLTTAEILTLPKSVGGYLDLKNLTTAEELTLPESVGGDLYLSNLTTAEGLTLPKTVGGDLILSSLTTAEILTLPKSVGGYLDLKNLTTAEELTLPESVGVSLYLMSFKTPERLTLPESVGGDLALRKLDRAERRDLKNRYPNLRIC